MICQSKENSALPLLVEGTAKGDVVLHRGVKQPRLLGSVGYRVPVLAGGIMGNEGKKTLNEKKIFCLHEASERRNADGERTTTFGKRSNSTTQKTIHQL